MIFTSTAREDVNRTVGWPPNFAAPVSVTDTVHPEDPEPWECEASTRHAIAECSEGWGVSYWPRPGYRAPQNPILVAFREPKAATIWHFIASLDEPAVWWPNATPAQIEHARKVLTRLANVYKED